MAAHQRWKCENASTSPTPPLQRLFSWKESAHPPSSVGNLSICIIHTHTNEAQGMWRGGWRGDNSPSLVCFSGIIVSKFTHLTWRSDTITQRAPSPSFPRRFYCYFYNPSGFSCSVDQLQYWEPLNKSGAPPHVPPPFFILSRSKWEYHMCQTHVVFF